MADEFEEFDDIDALMAEGDDFDMGDSSSSDGPVSTVDQISEGVVDSLNIDATAEKIKNSMLDSLPGNVGDGVYKAESAVDDLTEAFDKEMKPLKKATSATLGGIADVLPDSMADSVKSLKSWIDGDDESTGSNNEPTEDEKIASEVDQLLAKSAIEEQVNSKLASVQQKKDSELLSMIAEATTKTVVYKSEYDANYYKRSLELQLKQVLTTVKLYDLLKLDSENRSKQLDAIVKNTALPDFAKSRTSDIAKQMIMGTAKDVATNAFLKNDSISNLTKFGKEKMSGALGAATEMVGLGSDLSEILTMQMEQGATLTQVLSSMATDMVVDKAVSKGTDYALKKLFETQGGVKVLGDYDTFISDPQKALEKAKQAHIENGGSEEDLKYKALELGKEAIGEQYKTKSVNISNITDMRDAAQIDNKFVKTVDTVIPTYLSKMLNELTTIRKIAGNLQLSNDQQTNKVSSTNKGNSSLGSNTLGLQSSRPSDNVPKTEDELVYDFEKGRFVTKKDVKKVINEKIDKHVAKLADDIISSNIDELIVPDHLSIKERTSIALAISDYIMSGKSIAPAYMHEDGFLNYFKNDKELKKKVSKGLSRLESPENKLIYDQRAKLTQSLERLKKSSISNFSDIAKSADLNNSVDTLLEMGIVDEDNPNVISTKNVKDTYSKRIRKQTTGKIKESKLSLSEQQLVDSIKEKENKLKEKARTRDDKLKRTKTRTLRNYKDNEDAEKAFNKGIDSYGKTEDELDKVLNELIKDKPIEEANLIEEAFSLGLGQGLREAEELKRYKEERANLAKKYDNKVNRATKKMDEDEKSSFIDRLRAETLLEEIGSFSKGGSTGKGKDDEVAGIIHRNEYALNRKDIQDLANFISEGNVKKIVKFSTSILEDINKEDNVFDIKDIDKDIVTSFISKHIPDKVKDTYTDLKNNTKEFMEGDVVNDFYNNHKETFDSVKQFKDDKVSTIKTSYTKTKDKISKYIPETKVIEDAISNITKTLSSSLESISKDIPKNMTSVKENLTSFTETLGTTLGDMKTSLSTTFQEQMKSLGEFTDSIFRKGTLLSEAKDSVAGLASSQIKSVKEYVNGSTKSIRDELVEKGVLKIDKDGKIISVSSESIKDEINKTVDSVKNSKDDNIISKLVNTTTSMVSSGINSVKSVFSNTIDVTPEMLADIKNMEELVNEHGAGPIMKNYLASRPLPNNELAATDLYRAMFTVMDPSGQMWEKVKEMPDHLKDLEKLHVKAIEEGQKGLLGRALEASSNVFDKGSSLLGGMKDKIINSLPEPLRGPAKKLLDNKITKLAGNALTNLKKIGKGALKTTLDEMRIIGQEGKELFINKDGKLQVPNALKLAKFAGKAYGRSMVATGKGVRELYGGVLGKVDYKGKGFLGRFNKNNYEAQSGILTDTVKAAGGLAWDFTAGKSIKNTKKALNRLWAKVKPPITRELFNAWADGTMTAKDVEDALKTDEEKQIWRDWLKANTPSGVTLPKVLLKTGEWFVKSTVGTGKQVKKGYGSVFTAGKYAAKVAKDIAMEASGANDIKRSIKRTLTKPDIDKSLYRSWVKGDLTSNQVKDALQTQEEKDNWVKWLSGNATKHRSLPKLLNMTGKWFAKALGKTAAGVEVGYKSGFKKSKNVTGLASKVAYAVSGIDELLNSKDRHNVKFKTLLDIIPENMRAVVIDDISNNAKELGITTDELRILNENVNKLKRKDKQKLVRKMSDLVSLYLAEDDGLKDKIATDIKNLLLYTQSLNKHSKDTESNSSVKGVKVSTTKTFTGNKTSKEKEFLLGGWTGDGSVKDIAGKVHKEEYVINNKKVKELLNIVKKGNIDKINTFTTSIAKDIVKSSEKINEKIDKLDNPYEQMIELLKSINKSSSITASKPGLGSKFMETFTNIISDLKGTKDKVKSSLTRVGNRASVLKKLYGDKKEHAKRTIKEKLKDTKSDLWKTLLKFSPLIIGGITGLVKKYITEPFSNMFTSIKNVFSGGLSTITNTLTGVKTFLGDGILGLKTALLKPLNLITKLFGGLSDFMGSKFKSITTSLSSFKDSIVNKTKSFFGTDSKDVIDKPETHLKDTKVSTTSKTTKPVKKGFFSNLWSSAKAKAKSILPSSKTLGVDKLKSLWGVVKEKLFKKVGKKAGIRLASKTLAKFVPGVGTALLAYDAAKVGWDHFHNNTPLLNATSKQLLGFDVFEDDGESTSDVKKPLLEAINNTGYKPVIRPVNNPKFKSDIKLDSDGNVTTPTIGKVKIDTKDIKVPIEPLIQDLKRDEGVVLHKYKDSLGYETIGVGHLLDKRKGGKDLRTILGVDKDNITRDEADVILVDDINKTSKELYKALPWLETKPLNIQNDLTNMAFNLGVGGLLKFKNTLKHLENGDYKRTAAGLYQSKWRRQVGARADRIIADVASTPNDTVIESSSNNVVKPDVSTLVSKQQTKTTIDKSKQQYQQLPTKVSVNMDTVQESKHLSDVKEINGKTYEVLKDSLKVQTGMYDKLDKLVSLQEEQLKIMTNANSRRKQSNNTRFENDYKGKVDHKTANF